MASGACPTAVSGIASVGIPYAYDGNAGDFSGVVAGPTFAPTGLNCYMYFLSNYIPSSGPHAYSNQYIVSRVDRKTMTRIDAALPVSATASNEFAYGLAVDPNGDVWVTSGVYDGALGANGQGNRLYKFDKDLNFVAMTEVASIALWDVLDTQGQLAIVVNRSDGLYLGVCGSPGEAFMLIWNLSNMTLLADVLNPAGEPTTFHGSAPFAMCSDGTNFWMVSSANQDTHGAGHPAYLTKIAFTAGGAVTLTQYPTALAWGGTAFTTGLDGPAGAWLLYSSKDSTLIASVTDGTGGNNGLIKIDLNGNQLATSTLTLGGKAYSPPGVHVLDSYGLPAAAAACQVGFGITGLGLQFITVINGAPGSGAASVRFVLFDYQLNLCDITPLLFGVAELDTSGFAPSNFTIPGQFTLDASAGNFSRFNATGGVGTISFQYAAAAHWGWDPDNICLWATQPWTGNLSPQWQSYWNRICFPIPTIGGNAWIGIGHGLNLLSAQPTTSGGGSGPSGPCR